MGKADTKENILCFAKCIILPFLTSWVVPIYWSFCTCHSHASNSLAIRMMTAPLWWNVLSYCQVSSPLPVKFPWSCGNQVLKMANKAVFIRLLLLNEDMSVSNSLTRPVKYRTLEMLNFAVAKLIFCLIKYYVHVENNRPMKYRFTLAEKIHFRNVTGWIRMFTEHEELEVHHVNI